MSYSGYSQILCKNGHWFDFDAYDEPQLTKNQFPWNDEDSNEDLWYCPYCKQIAAWENSVDLTNGSWEDYQIPHEWYVKEDSEDETKGYWYCQDINGNEIKMRYAKRIDGYVSLKMKNDYEFEECKCCGNKKVISHPTYHIPENEGHLINQDE